MDAQHSDFVIPIVCYSVSLAVVLGGSILVLFTPRSDRRDRFISVLFAVSVFLVFLLRLCTHKLAPDERIPTIAELFGSAVVAFVTNAVAIQGDRNENSKIRPRITHHISSAGSVRPRRRLRKRSQRTLS